MANNFNSDSRIIEYWRFENNLNAGKAGNDLTASAGGVSYDSSNPMEGLYSLDLEADNNQWASITDAALSSGFPLKSGDSVKKVSWACWIRPESSFNFYFLSKYSAATNGRSLGLLRYLNELYVYWGYNNGNSFVSWDTSFGLVAGRDYHIGIAVDGIARTALLRIWDDFNSTAYTYTKTDWGYDLYVSTAPFVVGNRGNLDTAYNWDGRVDETVVADNLLSADEFDQIRQGIFLTSNLVTNNASHTNILTSVILESNTITINNPSHTNIITSPTIEITEATLNINNMENIQTIDNITLSPIIFNPQWMLMMM